METPSIKSGTTVLAKVKIMGAKRGAGWRYTYYTAKAGTRSGYIFAGACSMGMYDNKANHKYSAELEASKKAEGLFVVDGRPFAGKNAPKVI